MVGYEHDLKLWIEHIGDLDVAKVHSGHILSFLSYLRTDYVPRRIVGDGHTGQELPRLEFLLQFLEQGHEIHV